MLHQSGMPRCRRIPRCLQKGIEQCQYVIKRQVDVPEAFPIHHMKAAPVRQDIAGIEIPMLWDNWQRI